MILDFTSTDKAGAGNVGKQAAANRVVAATLQRAEQGDPQAYYQLGLAYSTGSEEVDCDLVEAHKWLNLAAAQGHVEAKTCRADIAEELTARQINEAQSRARLWLVVNQRLAA
jgi:TPR repeat protein